MNGITIISRCVFGFNLFQMSARTRARAIIRREDGKKIERNSRLYSMRASIKKDKKKKPPANENVIITAGKTE